MYSTGTPLGFDDYIDVNNVTGAVYVTKALVDFGFSDVFFLIEVTSHCSVGKYGMQ